MAELLRMPEVAAGMESALLSTWSVTVSTPYSAGDVIAVIETDKAVVDVEAETDGVIVRTLVSDGDEVPVGAPIALIAAASETITDIDALLRDLGVGEGGKAAPAAVATGNESPSVESPTLVPTVDAGSSAPRRFASPLARRMAREAGVDIAQIQGTGPGGRIVRRDVEAAARTAGSERTAVPSAPIVPGPRTASTGGAGFTDTPHSRLRRAIATRLTESKQTAPHFYLRGTATVDRLLAMREEINAGEDVRISVNDLVIKAVATAHTQLPGLNVTWGPDAVRNFTSVDVAVAIATDTGLVTPVLRSVETMPVHVIAATVRDYADRARAGRLQQHELEGGTISVTNLGMYGTEEFAAIINPPHAAILAVGAAHQEPVAVDGALAIATVMRVTLSIDHRPVDGVTGAQWMRVFLGLLENPAKILA